MQTFACGRVAAPLKPQRSQQLRPAQPRKVSRRRWVCSASSADTPQTLMDDPATQAAVEANVDLVGEMLGEVCNRMVVESAAAYVTSGQMNITAQNTIRDAVRSRMDRFDQVTLSVLTSLVESTAAPDDAETHSLLIALRAEIVKQVGGTLPEELQTLNALAALTEQKERRELLSAKDEETLDSTGRAAEQLINEMEELPAIPDVRLLTRLVVVFEEVYAAMDGVRGGAAGELRTLRPNVPAAIATFVSQLLKVGDPVARRAQIYTALKAGCKKVAKKAVGSENTDIIRPGAYMQTLYTLRTEMFNAEGAAGAEARSTQLKMRNLVMDSMLVLDDISRGK